MSDATIEEPSKPSAFNLPSSSRQEELTYPDRPLHVLLATTGSVASVKAPLIVKQLLSYENVAVQIVATKSSLAFYSHKDLEQEIQTKSVKVWQDDDEWNSWQRVGDAILHIELRRWADIVLIAPCSANTLAKLSSGICDNLLTSMMRALDVKRTQVYVFPAMNTFMYEHPLTEPQLVTLRNTLGYNVIGPVGKVLACGDVGKGAMTEWTDIVKLVIDKFGLLERRPA